MSDTVIVRRADEDDVHSLIALRYQWRVDEGGESGRTLEEFEAEFREWLENHRSTHLGYLALMDDVAVGCAWLFVVDRVPGPGKFIRRAGMLQSVYVQPERRSASVGSQLVQFVIDDAKTMSLDYLMVHPSTKSFEFYRRLGFSGAEKALELRFT
jgi:GNAT superfamily N-acetyltransferase